MTFSKRDIKDRIIEHPSRYQLNPVVGETDTYDLSPVTGAIVQEGTKVNKQYLQPIEDTLEDITTPKYGTSTGTNNYAVTIPKITTLFVGLQITVKFPNRSTGTTNINVNGLGNKQLIKAGGGSPLIKANGIYNLMYDGSVFQLLGEGGEYGTAQASDVLAPKTIGTDNGLVVGTIPSRSASTITPSTSTQTIASGQYLSGTQTISAVAGLSAGNVKNGTVVGGVTGTYKGLGNATASQVLSGRTFSTATLSNATGTMTNRGAVTKSISTQGGSYTVPAGYHTGAGKVTASFANLVAGNVKKDVNIGGVVGTLVPMPTIRHKSSLNSSDSTVCSTYITPPTGYKLISAQAKTLAGWNNDLEYSISVSSPSGVLPVDNSMSEHSIYISYADNGRIKGSAYFRGIGGSFLTVVQLSCIFVLE